MADKHQNPPSFRATGKGYFNKLPDFPATAANCNAKFVNLGKQGKDPLHQIFLFVTGVSTGWTVAGDYGQSAGARTFYPKNLSQSPVTIQGIVANQYEYDRLVEFVIAHQITATDVRNPKDTTGTTAVKFYLQPYKVPKGKDVNGNIIYRTIHSAMVVDGYILGMQAGATAGVNAPTWTMDLKVSNDYLQNNVHLTSQINQILKEQYLKSFGTIYKVKSPNGVPPVPDNGASGNNTDVDSVFFQHLNQEDVQ